MHKDPNWYTPWPGEDPTRTPMPLGIQWLVVIGLLTCGLAATVLIDWVAQIAQHWADGVFGP